MLTASRYEIVNVNESHPIFVDYAACAASDAHACILSDGALVEIAGLEFQFYFEEP